MQRRDYYRIAEALRRGKTVVAVIVTAGRRLTPGQAADMVILHVADELARDNPKFDKDLFLRNSGVTLPTEH